MMELEIALIKGVKKFRLKTENKIEVLESISLQHGIDRILEENDEDIQISSFWIPNNLIFTISKKNTDLSVEVGRFKESFLRTNYEIGIDSSEKEILEFINVWEDLLKGISELKALPENQLLKTYKIKENK